MDNKTAGSDRDYRKVWSYYQTEATGTFRNSAFRLHSIARYLQRGQRVLNVGIGGGLLEHVCSQIGATVLSLDPDWNSLERHNRNGYRLTAGKIEDIPFADGVFDAVVVSEVLEHLTPEVTRIALMEIHRVLRPEGRLIGTVPCAENLSDGTVMCPKCGEIFHKVGHLQSFDTKSLSSLLKTVFPRSTCFERAFMAKPSASPLERTIGHIRNFFVLTGLLTREKHIVFLARKQPLGRRGEHRFSGGNRNGARIALFLPSLAGGGAEKRMLNLSAEFIRKGYCVDLLLAKAEGAYMGSVPASVRVIDLRSLKPLTAIPALVRYIDAIKPQALLSTITNANIAAIIASCAASTKIRCVICEASHLSSELPHASALNRLLMPWLMKFLYSKASAIVAVSQATAQDLVHVLGIPPEAVKVIYNPVITDDLLARMQLKTSHPWAATKQCPIIIGMGRLTRQKNFETLIRAFALVRKQIPSKLIILGEGEDRPQLQHLCEMLGVSEDVDLPGFVANPYPLLRKARLFVLSSRWEGLPWVLVEALACGTRVLSTDCPGGPREILDNGTYGQLCPVGNVHRMAESIIIALGNDDVAADPKNWLSLFNSKSCSADYLNLLVGQAAG